MSPGFPATARLAAALLLLCGSTALGTEPVAPQAVPAPAAPLAPAATAAVEPPVVPAAPAAAIAPAAGSEVPAAGAPAPVVAAAAEPTAAAVVSTAASAATATPARATSTPGDQARFLAGLPVASGSPLYALEQNQDWKDHQAAMARSWPKLAERLEKAARFEAGTLAPLIQRDRKVIYFFGGPDAAHAVTLFPEAPAYLLAGLEPVGAVEAPETMKFSEVHAAIDGLAVALKTIVDKSFFRTSDMGRDLQGKGIRGVQPVLYIFLARSGAEVLDAIYFEVSPAGEAKDKKPGEKFGPGVPGVRIRFQFPGRPVQEMSYVRVNLLDEELVRQPGFLTWAKGFGPANGFLKAASFILHDKAFSKPRAFLMEACAAILQDDSGVPYRVYKKAGDWDLTCFGTYARPRDPFERHEQKELGQACAAQPKRSLDFIIGYRRQNDTSLQLYTRKLAPPTTWSPSWAGASPAPPVAPPLVDPIASAATPPAAPPPTPIPTPTTTSTPTATSTPAAAPQ